MAVSVVLPWYSDIDAFKTGDTYFGITGPLYLIGVLFFGLSGTAIMTLFNYTVREKVEMVFSKLATFYMMTGGFCVFLLLLANSVYFHPRFGVNIAIKEARIGMWVALAGVGMLLYGGYNLRKRRARLSDMESHLEPLIRMPEDTISEGYMSEKRQHREVEPPAEREIDRTRTIGEVSAEQAVRRQDTLL